jgi:hypothetical protein
LDGGGVLDFIIIGIKRKGKRNIPGIFQNLNIFGQRFMLVATVPTNCVTWDKSKARPKWLE